MCLVYDILNILEYGFTGEIIEMLMCFISTFNPIYELFDIDIIVGGILRMKTSGRFISFSRVKSVS